MAKASKSESADQPASKTTRKKAPAKAKSTATTKAKTSSSRGAKAAPAAPADVPMIDTSLAAQTAARMLLARATGHVPATPPTGDSSTIKELKEQLAKPKAALNSLLQATGGGSSLPGSHLPHPRGQSGRASTHGTDATRTGVPRRTAG